MFYKNETLALVIDGPSTNNAANFADMMIDWNSIPKLFKEKGRLIRSTYITHLVVNEEGDTPLIRLLDFLQFNGFDVVARRAKAFTSDNGDQNIKGDNIHVEVTLAAMRAAEHVDHVVLFASDASYAPLIAELQRKGVRVSICGAKGQTADLLRRQADAFIEISNLRDMIAKADEGDAC